MEISALDKRRLLDLDCIVNTKSILKNLGEIHVLPCLGWNKKLDKEIGRVLNFKTNLSPGGSGCKYSRIPPKAFICNFFSFRIITRSKLYSLYARYFMDIAEMPSNFSGERVVRNCGSAFFSCDVRKAPRKTFPMCTGILSARQRGDASRARQFGPEYTLHQRTLCAVCDLLIGKHTRMAPTV